MKRFIVAAGLAMPLLVFSQQPASAEGLDLARWLRYRLCLCLHDKQAGEGHLGGGCASGHCGQGGCGQGGCGYGGCGNGACNRPPCGCCACGLFGCDQRVPGPWYLYWPYDGRTQQIAGYGFAWPVPWNYEMHFQYPSPWGTNAGFVAPASAVAFAPVPPVPAGAVFPSPVPALVPAVPPGTVPVPSASPVIPAPPPQVLPNTIGN
jgi:hypothetical protein